MDKFRKSVKYSWYFTYNRDSYKEGQLGQLVIRFLISHAFKLMLKLINSENYFYFEQSKKTNLAPINSTIVF